MRAMLINIQVMVILVMIFVTIAAGGGLASLTALGAGVGPAAFGAGLFIFMLFVGAIIGFVAVVLPTTLLAVSTLFFAILSGYRHLRWTRFVGAAVNAAFAFLVAGLYHLSEIEGSAFLIIPLFILPFINGCLFLLLPRRPDRRLTEKLTYCAIPVLHALPLVIVAAAIIAHPPDFNAADYVFLAILFLLYTLPFHFNFRTIPATRTLNGRLARRLAVSLAMTVLALILVFPLGLSLCLTTLLLLELAEFAVFHPASVPQPGGVHHWLARTLGRLPEATEPAATSATSIPDSP
jgi:hypothetical protein